MSRPSNEPNAWIARRAFEKLGVGEDHDWDDAQAGHVPVEGLMFLARSASCATA